MLDNDIIYDYEQVLVGRQSKPSMINVENLMTNDVIYELFRYSLSHYMKWTVPEAFTKLNSKIMHRLKWGCYIKYITDKPNTIDESSSATWILSQMYSEESHSFVYNEAISMLEHVHINSQKRFPKRFFDGYVGHERLGYILEYILNQLPPFKNLSGIYELFTSDEAMKKLRSYKLNLVIETMYPNMADLVYEFFDTDNDNSLLYNRYHKLWEEKHHEKV